jgi:hypothetical protein
MFGRKQQAPMKDRQTSILEEYESDQKQRKQLKARHILLDVAGIPIDIVEAIDDEDLLFLANEVEKRYRKAEEEARAKKIEMTLANLIAQASNCPIKP